MLGRAYIDPADLMKEVQADIELRVKNNETFSAWNITRALRGLSPGINYRHDDVRQCVHMVMNGVLGMNIYDRRDATGANGETYIEYFPLQVVQSTATPVTVTVPTAPHGLPAQIPVTQGQQPWLPAVSND